jgi:hypothetical protein
MPRAQSRWSVEVIEYARELGAMLADIIDLHRRLVQLHVERQ